MLRMQGTVREVALDLVRADGARLPVLVNAALERDADGEPARDPHRRCSTRPSAGHTSGSCCAPSSGPRRPRAARAGAGPHPPATLIPPAPPVVPGLDVAAAYRPAGRRRGGRRRLLRRLPDRRRRLGGRARRRLRQGRRRRRRHRPGAPHDPGAHRPAGPAQRRAPRRSTTSLLRAGHRPLLHRRARSVSAAGRRRLARHAELGRAPAAPAPVRRRPMSPRSGRPGPWSACSSTAQLHDQAVRSTPATSWCSTPTVSPRGAEGPSSSARSGCTARWSPTARQPLPADGILGDVLDFQRRHRPRRHRGGGRPRLPRHRWRPATRTEPDIRHRPAAAPRGVITVNSSRAGQLGRGPRTSSTSPTWSPPTTPGTPTRRPRPAGRVRHLRAPRQQPATTRSTRPTSSPPRRRSATTAPQQGYDGPLFIGRDTHGLSEPAWATALEVLAANDVTVLVDDRDALHARPRRCRTRSCAPTAASASRPARRRHRGHALAQPARATAASSTTRPTAAPPTPTPRSGSPTPPTSYIARPRWPACKRIPFARARAAAAPYDFLGTYVDDLPDVRRPRRDPGGRRRASAPTRSAARASTTGARSPSGTAST